MSVQFSSGGGPDRFREILRWLEERLAVAGDALAAAGDALLDAVDAIAATVVATVESTAARCGRWWAATRTWSGTRLRSWSRSWSAWWSGRWTRWSAARPAERVRRVGTRARTAMAWAGQRLRPGLLWLAAAAGSAVERLGPALRRLAAAARRRAPGRGQLAVAAILVFAAGAVLWQRCGLQGCPDIERLSSYRPDGASVLLDRDGEPFAKLAPVDHEMIPLDSLPDHVPMAFVAVEDRRFFRHRGVDWPRVPGALLADLRARGLVQGSSTIPMQLSRNLFPDRIRAREKTFRRKLLEVRMAREIEKRFSKAEILELYLNHIYFGGGAYGIQAASRYYFGKTAARLEVHEAAMLAALPRAPSHYDPFNHPDAARRRRDLVLALMERQRHLSFLEAQAAREREVDVVAEPRQDRDGEVFAPYFVQHVRRILEDRLGEELYTEPLRILTTLDPRAQTAAEEELTRQLEAVEKGWFGRFRAERYSRTDRPGARRTDYLQGAVVVMDARTGDVQAWVGGRDFDQSRYDRARLARRQAGSAFKPFVYAAALEKRFPPSQPILDAPYRFSAGGGPPAEPRNYSGGFLGRVSMREALARSQNVPAVRMAAAVGPEEVADLARRAGVRGDIPASPILALGVTSVSPLEMATAFASFATLGTRTDPRFILRVEDADGTVLWEPEPARRWNVAEPAVAYLLTDMLRTVVDGGTGTAVRRVGFRGPAAGKTGTSNDANDVWFVGYTPELVGVVWVGHDEVRPLPAGATGGGVAAPAWGRIMARIHENRPLPPPWTPPPGLVADWVDPESGRILEDGCYPWYGGVTRELFLADAVPASICPRGSYWYDRFTGWFDRDRDDHRAGRDIDPHLGAPRLAPRGRAPAGVAGAGSR